PLYAIPSILLFFFLLISPQPLSPLLPYTTLFRSHPPRSDRQNLRPAHRYPPCRQTKNLRTSHTVPEIYVKKEKPRPGKRSAAFPCRQAYRSFFIPSSLLRVGINIPLKNEKVNK